MRTNPTLPKIPMTYSHDLESAGWLMAKSRSQQLAQVEFWEQNGEAHLTCHFQSEPGVSPDFLEYVKEKHEHPAAYRANVAAGLARLTAYLNELLQAPKNAPTLNNPTKPAQQPGRKNVTTLNTESEAAYV